MGEGGREGGMLWGREGWGRDVVVGLIERDKQLISREGVVWRGELLEC